MRFRRIAGAAILCAGAIQSMAYAQTVLLICSAGPNQPLRATIEIDYGRSVVNYPAPDIPARISDRSIDWQTPQQADSAGHVRPPGRFSLDRLTGEFRQQYICDACVPTPIILFCKPGAKLF